MNKKPFEILPPEQRWAPGREQLKAANDKYEMLLAPLVHKVRKAVEEWRNNNYEGATETTKALLNHWFNREHINEYGTPFRFYFAQQEAIESVIYLYEIAEAKDKYELIKFDASGRVSAGMFDENWTRYVVKMATGTGKTKVLGLVLVWSYFNAKYEHGTGLSKNFLVIAPNIIVLNRIRKDFDGLKTFFEDPFIPENGWENRDWLNDFQLTLHIQDELKSISETGNIFLSNIHRVFLNEETEPTVEEFFLGKKPKPDADTSKGLDLGKVLRSDKIKDLVVLNDEAHHIHDASLAWFKSIEDISNKLKLKTGKPIPEQSFSITSVTTLKTNHYETPKGSFLYQSVKPSLFFGYRVIPSNRRPILMAEPEKAILDFLYLHPELKNASDMEALRLNSHELETLDEKRMNKYLQLFGNRVLNKRFGFFKEVNHVGTV